MVSGDKINQIETTKAKFKNLNFLNVHPILVHIFLQNDHYYGLLMDCKKNSILF
jgi:hypothetical protein